MAASKILNWICPLILAKKIAANYSESSWIFLYSGLNDEIKNSRSFIALFPKNNFHNLENLENQCFGYVSYEYNHHEKCQKSFIEMPEIWLANFSIIFEFDHDKKLVKACYDSLSKLDEILNYQQKKSDFALKVKNIYSNFSDISYLETIKQIKQMIACGDFYQLNLTRKFFGEFNLENQNDFFELFLKLSAASPANYSAFLKFKDNYIISASPELFLAAQNGHVTSRPIKGTARRDPDLAIDQKNKNILQNSEKERAENLMIVDLVRNDLARICKAGSVVVKNLFKVNTYKTLHHMSSEIHGEIAENFSTINAFKSCFPAGSMTGAPKIEVMKKIAEIEKINRGIYSGAIGYFNDSESNFSVVIRTLICQKNKFEFQVGGAITFDSDPQSELQETYIKAKAIMQILNIESL